MRSRFIIAALVCTIIVGATIGYIIVNRPIESTDFGRQALVPTFGVIYDHNHTGMVEFEVRLLDEKVTSLFGSPDNVISITLIGDSAIKASDWRWTIASTDQQRALVRTITIVLETPDQFVTVDRIAFKFANGDHKEFPAGQFKIGPFDSEVKTHSNFVLNVNCFLDYDWHDDEHSFVIWAQGIDAADADIILTDVLNMDLVELDRDGAFQRAPIWEDDAGVFTDLGLPLVLELPESQADREAWVEIPVTMPRSEEFYCFHLYPVLVFEVGGEQELVAPHRSMNYQRSPYSPSDQSQFLEEWGR